MSQTAHAQSTRRVLRVFVSAVDSVRQVGLASIVGAAGHAVSNDANDADVVLTDGVAPGMGPPVVTLGESDGAQSGVLPRDASAEQIDAAIRAVAAGLVVRPASAPQPSFDAMPESGSAILTPREAEVLGAIGNGLSNKEVARQLHPDSDDPDCRCEDPQWGQRTNPLSREGAGHLPGSSARW